MSIDIEKLRFPIGKFIIEPVKEEDYAGLIEELVVLPGKIRAAVNGLTDEQLEVRLLDCLVFTGFIHSNLINVDVDLVVIIKL